ncbi:hypothetical protein Bca52824_034926 [Brassica carinata]|uniref:Uncharacterized protein n=1 Tax=Brassica carinata TaxID=52824 RepID=A0A8X7V195_BRACI|nr:hypothetical protein Bca52824_034926 [Brassica carinata]
MLDTFPLMLLQLHGNLGKQLTPCTPRNIIKCTKSMLQWNSNVDVLQASYGSLKVTNLASERPRSVLQDKTNICSFMDHLDEHLHSDTFQAQISGDESEEDGNAVINSVMFCVDVDRFDENFQADCSSQESTDSESDPETEVVDLNVSKEPNNIPNRNRVKSLASLSEEAFRATEKPAKKALPKEDISRV